MRSNVKHIRVEFEPLLISCSIKCDTPASPLVQVSNALLGEFEPDRAISPCVIRPYVNVKDPDGIFGDGNINAKLALDSIIWKFNNIPIEEIPAFKDKFEIIKTDNELRGSLKIFRNVPVTEKYVISFTAEFEDWRRPKTEIVQSNELTMSTTDVGEDLFKISVDNPAFVYNPILDNLLLYDYMKANNLYSGNRDNYRDSNSFEKRIIILVNTGNKNISVLPAGISIELKEKGGEIVIPGTVKNPEVLSMQFPYIDFDLRMIEKKEYELNLYREDKKLSSMSFSIRREDPVPHQLIPTKGADISPQQELYYNSALVNLKDTTLLYPELYFLIRWFTEAQLLNKATGKYEPAGEIQHNFGTKLEIPIEKIGIGFTKNDNHFSVGFDVEPHAACKLMISNDDDVFTDNDGNYFII